LKVLQKNLQKVQRSGRVIDNLLPETEDPASSPTFWINKWVDYTEKHGISYQLCDNSIGVLFNDFTHILLMADEKSLLYIERNGAEAYHSLKTYPKEMEKKITMLLNFKEYMQDLLTMGDKDPDDDDMTRLPYLLEWFRTRNAIVFMLNDGTVQINFFQDHTKMILCPILNAVTYINEKCQFRTYRVDQLEFLGSSEELNHRLRYACKVLDRICTKNANSGPVSRV